MSIENKDDYAANSSWYDRLLNPFLNHIRQALVDWIIANQPRCVLDVGCGTGKQLSMLPRDVSAIGIDISDAMLDQAKTQADGKCQYGDATNIPFEESEFDLVISQFALHEKDTDTIKAELSEIRRVLKPSGLFSVTDFDIPIKSTWTSYLIGWGIKQIEKKAGDEHYENYKMWMKRGGLENVMVNSSWKLVEDIPFYKGNIRLTFWALV